MMTTEDAIKKTLEDIDDMEAVNAILPELKKVVTAWNGKVLNKRFEDALKEAIPGRIYLSSQYENSWEVCYQPEGCKSNTWYTVLHGSRPSCKYYTQENSFVNPDKRIAADRAFTIIEAARVKRLQQITSYREHLRTWEAKKAQLDMLKKQLKTISDSIPYTLQDRFNMRVKYY